MKKKVDPQVRALVERNLKLRYRTLFIIVGDRSSEQIANLHYMLTRISATADNPVLSSTKVGSKAATTGPQITAGKPSVLWCYNKDLGFSSHRKKRLKMIKKKIQTNAYDPNTEDPFELFVSTTNIRYCYYKETQGVLGQTYGMCVLQDFESLTPDILCRTIETVSGGGIVCLLLNKMSSLKTLYTLAMDHHGKYRDGLSLVGDVEPQFNKRLILSLADCASCLVVDDELNVLPISEGVYNGIQAAKKVKAPSKDQLPDSQIDDSMNDESSPVVDQHKNASPLVLAASRSGGSEISPASITSLSTTDNVSNVPVILELINKVAATEGQKKLVREISDVLLERSTHSVMSITAARGRGKSAALGLGLASAVALSYSSIFVTSPHPENVQTLFQFLQKGLQALGMTEHKDFEVLQEESKLDTSNYNTHISRTVMRINIFREHRQSIQYIEPSAVHLSQVELLVIDEAAAIPLPTVKSLLGSFPILMASTINGYEGTGRSLSLKLIQDLKSNSGAMKRHNKVVTEISLEEPIRYASGDYVEGWLNGVLCLDACTPALLKAQASLPVPKECKLYMVNRVALFSYHAASEQFLHNLMSLFVSSHYKNSPGDLLLLADAPMHFVFVLMPPIDPNQTTLPDIYCAIQVCIEGGLAKDVVKKSLGRGLRPSGDLLPWTLSQNFIDEDFASLTGVRVIRIATHPSLQRMGYGSVAMKQLIEYFEGCGASLDDQKVTPQADVAQKKTTQNKNEENNLLTEKIEKCAAPPPLLSTCSDAATICVPDYLGTCFGLTLDLFKFWNRKSFKPVYLRQTKNPITGEHSAILLRQLHQTSDSQASNWLDNFVSDFRSRFTGLLGHTFTDFSTMLALYLLDPPTANQNNRPDEAATIDNLPPVNYKTVGEFFTAHDLRRLEKYAKQLADYPLIVDLLPQIASLIFRNRLRGINFSYLQCAILLALGCQRRSVETVAAEFNIPTNQAMALLNKAIHKLSNHIQRIQESDPDVTNVTSPTPAETKPLGDGLFTGKTFTEEQDEHGLEVSKELEQKRKNLLESLKTDKILQKYVFDADAEANNKALKDNWNDKNSFKRKGSKHEGRHKKHKKASSTKSF